MSAGPCAWGMGWLRRPKIFAVLCSSGPVRHCVGLTRLCLAVPRRAVRCHIVSLCRARLAGPVRRACIIRAVAFCSLRSAVLAMPGRACSRFVLLCWFSRVEGMGGVGGRRRRGWKHRILIAIHDLFPRLQHLCFRDPREPCAEIEAGYCLLTQVGGELLELAALI